MAASNAIVGFHSPQSPSQATAILDKVPGFQRVQHVFQLSPCALIDVEAALLSTFISQARDYGAPHVAYCHGNPRIYPTAFQSQLPGCGEALQSNIALAGVHGITSSTALSGLGVRIGLLDTGIAPHPFLPAAHLPDQITRPEDWNDLIRPLAPYLQSNLVGVDLRASPADIDSRVRITFDELFRALSNHPHVSAAYRVAEERIVPFRHGVFGALRCISPYSRSFVGDPASIIDNSGHGTYMAGCVASLPHGNILNQLARVGSNRQLHDQLVRATVWVEGPAPYAELVVLKCYDRDLAPSSTLGAWLKALDHAATVNCDIIYFGLAVEPEALGSTLGYAGAQALASHIACAKAKGILCVAAIGNQGASSLAVPSAFPDVLSVGGVQIDQGVLIPYRRSNQPMPNEAVSVAGLADISGTGILGLGLHGGFQTLDGTSIAAATTAGILARALGLHSISRWHHSLAAPISLPSPVGSRFAKARANTDAIAVATKRAAKQISFANHAVGAGVVREFTID